jgi:glycosyltransferase involved in cell wall biosynthesis
MMPKVSVIITTYNRPHLLPRAIESARTAGTDVEIVVVDDASRDDTADVCSNYTDIRYVRAERNQKVAGARNLGIRASSGEYISFLDDDDVRLPGSLNIQIEALASTPGAEFVYGQALLGDQDGRTDGSFFPLTCPQGDLFWDLFEQNFIPCSSVVFRKDCLDRVGLLHETIPGVDDWDLWVRFAEHYTIAAVDEPVVIWRQSTPVSGQGSSDMVVLVSLVSHLLRHRWLALPRALGASPQKRQDAWRRFSKNVSDHLIWESMSSFITGDRRRARRSAVTALRLHPSGLLGTACRWTRPSTLRTFLAADWTQDGLMSAKMHLKQVRASRGE